MAVQWAVWDTVDVDARPLRHALRRDLPDIVELWVEAFADDPYLRWIEPDDERWTTFGAAWMTFIVDLVFERGHTYLADPVDVAVAWVPPDVAVVGPDDVARGRSIIAEHAGEALADDALSTIMNARAHALDEPHWTLQYIGVRPGRQGAGLGAAAMASMLAVCDAEVLACARCTGYRSPPEPTHPGRWAASPKASAGQWWLRLPGSGSENHEPTVGGHDGWLGEPPSERGVMVEMPVADDDDTATGS